MSPGVFTGIFPSGNYGPPPGFCFDQFCNDEPINDDTVLHVRRNPHFPHFGGLRLSLSCCSLMAWAGRERAGAGGPVCVPRDGPQGLL